MQVLEFASKTVNMLHAVTGGRRVHLRFIAALNPFRSTQCMPIVNIRDLVVAYMAVR